MKKLVILCLLLAASHVWAQCSGSGVAWSCAAGSTSAQIQGAINSSMDGAVITLAAGSYTVSVGGVNFSNSHGATLICATPPQTVGAATVNPCTFYTSGTITAIGGGGYFGGTNPYVYRVSGFTFDGSGSGNGHVLNWDNYNGTNGPLTMYGPNNLGGIRVDHNTFQNFLGAAEVIFFGHIGLQSSGTDGIGQYAGVVDHNLFTGADQYNALFWANNPSSSPPSVQLGSWNNIFFEDNNIDFSAMTDASNAGCTDGWGGAAFVIRHNASRDCLWAMHGSTHAGGPANYEFYNNSVTLDLNATGDEDGGGPTTIDCIRCVHLQGSGTSIAFNNTFTVAAGNSKSGSPVVQQDYRSYAFGPSEDTGVVACDGTVLSYSWEDIVFSDGNRTPSGSNYGYPCWHQPGRDFYGNYYPIYSWNNYWSDTLTLINWVMADTGGVVPNGSFPPNNCNPTATGNCDYFTFHMKANREWFNAVSASGQSSPTSPFNGTTGMGFGTVANRPTTCTTSTETAFGAGAAGVGYFATDVGSQGTLYTCSATNTWTVYYTPYTYPHPLVAGEQPPQPPTGLQALVN
jgi:hypothetical protein